MNIYDIAEEAGVSIATVSRVLNGSSKVKESTRTRIEEILKRNRYAPSVFARGMVSGSMRTVGVLAIDVRDIYYGTVTYAIEHAFLEEGYNTVLCNTGGLPERQLHYLSLLTARQVDGIILVGSAFKDQGLESALREVSADIPVVMLNRQLEGENIRSVICDEKQGTADCVAHLAAAGHRSIRYIQDTDTYSAIRKLEGFKAGMSAAGLPLGKESIIETVKGFAGGVSAAESLAGSDFSALVTGDDLTAAGVCKGLRRIGRVPGRDTAVTGFNDSIIALSTDPELTSVDNRAEEMGKTASALLCRLLSGGDVPEVSILEPKLIIRASTR